MNAADARAMVAQFAWHATPVQREAIVQQMMATGACALHAAWELYGRRKGKPCRCSPCEAAPVVGTELVIRILVQGRAMDEAR